MKEFIASKKRRDRVQKINEGDIGETSDYVTKKQGDYYDYDDYASGGIARMLGERPRYQMGGDVAYDATNQDIYGSSAITVTPDTIMGPGGNQIQDKMGKPGLTYKPPQIGPFENDNSPVTGLPSLAPPSMQPILEPPGGLFSPFPDIEFSGISGAAMGPDNPIGIKYKGENMSTSQGLLTAYQEAVEYARKKRADGFMGRVVLPGEMGFEDFSKQYNSGGFQAGPINSELDLPAVGRNNNVGGILPVMPPKSEYYTGKDYGPGMRPYTAVMPQPGMRYVYDEKGTRHSVPIEGYEGPTSGMPLTQELKSQQLTANYGDSPLASTVRTNMLSGGIARMLGE
jgi:hypothetical protein